MVFSTPKVKTGEAPVGSILLSCVLYWKDEASEEKLQEVEEGKITQMLLRDYDVL